MAATSLPVLPADPSALSDDDLGDAHIDLFAAFEDHASVVGRRAAHASEVGRALRAVEGELDERGLLR